MGIVSMVARDDLEGSSTHVVCTRMACERCHQRLLMALCVAAFVLVCPQHGGVVGAASDAVLHAGVGSHDITGPAADEGTMGYAVLTTTTHGINMRLRARAFVFGYGEVEQADIESGLGMARGTRADSTTPPSGMTGEGRRMVIVQVEECMVFTSVKAYVVKRLQSIFPDGRYDLDNVMLSATHTHSAPGGYSTYVLYNVTTLGFNKKNWETIVDGIVAAIVKADTAMRPARLAYTTEELLEASISRSAPAYLMNPVAERNLYAYNVDKDMTLLRIDEVDAITGDVVKPMGILSWYPVHGVSLTNINELISSDNKGYAAQKWERIMSDGALPGGDGDFVAAFMNCNEGDVTPNTQGAYCPDGTLCDNIYSKCKKGQCQGLGPGENMFESCAIIGDQQYSTSHRAWERAEANSTHESGPDDATVHVVPRTGGTIDVRHTFVDMPEYVVQATGNRLCRPALGYSFAAGTTDGPGMFFEQATNGSGDPFWNTIRMAIKKPSREQIRCQAPKPILFDVGEKEPYPWSADILPFQVARLGSLIIVAPPAELTTMSGRRLRDQVYKALARADESSVQEAQATYHVVISGLSNAYSHYVATEDEYVLQRYEAASTLYGKHTLSAHMEILSALAGALVQQRSVKAGPTPPDMMDRTFNLKPARVLDLHPISKGFGHVHHEPRLVTGYKDPYTKRDPETRAASSFQAGRDTVLAEFWCAYPNNDYMIGKTFIDAVRQDTPGASGAPTPVGTADGTTVVAVDAMWDLTFRWRRYLEAMSICTAEWSVPAATAPGRYALRVYGHALILMDEANPIMDMSDNDEVAAKSHLESFTGHTVWFDVTAAPA